MTTALLSRIRAVQSEQCERAQGVLEFAVLLPFLLMLFLGTVDFARFMYYDTALQNAARVGAVMASNHCPPSPTAPCGTSPTYVGTGYVMWATSCDLQNLNPPVSAFTPRYSCTVSGSGFTPSCTSASCSNCAADICVCTNGTCSSPPTPQRGDKVTVNVGYDFQSISPLMAVFFSNDSAWTNGCWSGDPAHTHTLCASATGKVS